MRTDIQARNCYSSINQVVGRVMVIATSVKSKTVNFLFGCRSIFISPYRLEIYGAFFFDERLVPALDLVTARSILGMMDHRMSAQREKKRRKKEGDKGNVQGNWL
jgi:hypothetical protein